MQIKPIDPNDIRDPRLACIHLTEQGLALVGHDETTTVAERFVDAVFNGQVAEAGRLLRVCRPLEVTLKVAADFGLPGEPDAKVFAFAFAYDGVPLGCLPATTHALDSARCNGAHYAAIEQVESLW